MPRKIARDSELVAMGVRLREARVRASLTQAAVDVQLGKAADSNYTSSLENGRAGSPQLATMRTLAELYGVTLDWIIAGKSAVAVEVHQHTDGELLGRVTDVVERAYREEGVSLPSLELGRIVAREYDLAARMPPEQRPIVLQLLNERCRHEIRTESLGRQKASG